MREHEDTLPAAGAPLRIIPLGGVGEIGKAMTVYEWDDRLLVVDAGLMFPDQEMPGVDIVIPDMSWLVENRERVCGLALTHAHEDHVGAVPYFLREIDAPVYGTPLTIGIVRGKLLEHQDEGPPPDLRTVELGTAVDIGPFRVEFIRVCHSIPDSAALGIHTGGGVVVHTGDYKFDQTPIDGNKTQMERLAALGDEGVLVLVTDCTNSESPGLTPSERVVGESLERLFAGADGRIIVATFASNIHRLQQVIDVSARFGRCVAATGMSMLRNIEVASELGRLHAPPGLLVDIEDIADRPPEQVTILTTGSQGEPVSALTLMAKDENRRVSIIPGDTVIISATPIPGNEALIYRTINQLFDRGAQVFYDDIHPVHVSGHGNQSDLQLMLNLTRPRFVLPLHGEARHQAHYVDLACQAGIERENVVTPDLGDVLAFGPDWFAVEDQVDAGAVMIDGLSIGDVGRVVLRERRHLGDDGILVVALAVDEERGRVVGSPLLESRGFVYLEHSEDLLREAMAEVEEYLTDLEPMELLDEEYLRSGLRRCLARFCKQKLRRKPVVVPAVVYVGEGRESE